MTAKLSGLPAVVGQILVGVLLGSMVIGPVEPGEFHGEPLLGNRSGIYVLTQIGLFVSYQPSISRWPLSARSIKSPTISKFLLRDVTTAH